MNRGGIGSASLMLIFVVLCLTIFSVISLVPALTGQTLIQAELHLVESFFAADSKAEQIVAELLAVDETPEDIMGIEISSFFDWYSLLYIASFAVPITDSQVLYVSIGIDFDDYQILAWRMMNLDEWIADERLRVWPGYFDDEFFRGW